MAGECARQSFDESRAAACPPGVGFTAIYSRRDGIVDWRACVDPLAPCRSRCTTSHVGMALDPRVIDARRRPRCAAAPASQLLEVDRGESA